MFPLPHLHAPQAPTGPDAAAARAPLADATAPLPLRGTLWRDLLRLGLLPCAVLTLLLVGAFTVVRLRTLDTAFDTGGRAAARQLAALAEADLQAGDAPALQRLAATLLRSGMATRVEIEGDAGTLRVAVDLDVNLPDAAPPAPAQRSFTARVVRASAPGVLPDVPPRPPGALASEVPLGVVRVFRDATTLVHERNRTLLAAALAALLALAAGALAVRPLGGRLARPVRRITQTATALAGGQLEARCGIVAHGQGRAPHELVTLAQQVDRLGERLQAARGSPHAPPDPADAERDGAEPQREPDDAAAPALGPQPAQPPPPWPADPFVEARLAEARAGAPPVVRPQQDGAVFRGVLPEPPLQATGERWAGALIELWRVDRRQPPGSAAADLPLTTLFEPLAAQFAGQAAQARIRLLWRDRGLGVHGEAAPLQRVLSHLVSHAMRQVPPEGTVLVVARRAARGVRIEVRDNGVGLAPVHHRRIFDAFYHAGPLDNGRSSGFGLGLAIAARAAQRLGTHIAVRSAPGRGSCFALVLPRSSAAPPPAVGSLAGLHCLLVGDTAVLAPANALLQQWGCTLSHAANAMQAVTTLTRIASHLPADAPPTRIDVLLCQAELGALGGMGGEGSLAVVEALHRLQPRAQAIVLSTAPGTSDTLRRLRHQGALRLALPVSPARLRALLTAQVGRARGV